MSWLCQVLKVECRSLKHLWYYVMSLLRHLEVTFAKPQTNLEQQQATFLTWMYYVSNCIIKTYVLRVIIIKSLIISYRPRISII